MQREIFLRDVEELFRLVFGLAVGTYLIVELLKTWLTRTLPVPIIAGWILVIGIGYLFAVMLIRLYYFASRCFQGRHSD